MTEKVEAKKSPKSRSLTATLAIAFVALSLVALLVASSLQLYAYFLAQQAVVAGEQRLIALEAANTVQDYIQERFGELEAAVKFSELSSVSAAESEQNLEKLLGLEPAFRQLVLFDAEEQVLAQASRLSQAASEITSRLEAELFAQIGQGARYISPAYIDDITFEPLIVIAVPVKNIFGDFQGTLVAEVNLKFMWDLVDRLEVGETGVAYVVDRQGRLLAFGDITRVLAGENLSHLDEVAEFVNRTEPSLELEEEGAPVSTGINGTNVIATHIPLGTPDWAVVTELPLAEAYRAVIQNIISSGVITLIVAALAAGGGAYLARRLAAPLLNLTETATRITKGDIELQAGAEGPTEVSRLAEAFNSMTAQLRGLIGSLEQRVADRTRRLEIVATLGERLNAILNFEQLLDELVNQVKEQFDYYHAHVYIIDDKHQNLIMTAGAGEAGAAMKAQGHHISLEAPTSLVARAARTDEIVWVDNVREAKDWLPNPLLPDTHSEMAVPIIIDGKVVGVLDVQQDRIAGLDEGDAGLLRSLANQVAVAIRNARLFAEVEASLAAAHAMQARYLQQGWAVVDSTGKGGTYHYHRPDAPPLEIDLTPQLEQEVIKRSEPVVVAINGEDLSQDKDTKSQNQTAVVAPIRLQNQTIGAIKLQDADLSQPRQWSERELAMIQAVADQVAQTAENLRLFEEIRGRASRERLIGRVSDKLRSASDMDTLVKTAVNELSRVLGPSRTFVRFGSEAQLGVPGHEISGNGENPEPGDPLNTEAELSKNGTTQPDANE